MPRAAKYHVDYLSRVDDNVPLDLERDLDDPPSPDPYSSGRSICKLWQRGQCRRGRQCEFSHQKAEKLVLCKHWLRALCKKEENCEFLHEYDLSKMPECWFFSKFGECTNEDCQYIHIDTDKESVECVWYNRGFCKHGPNCRHRHVKRKLCENYLFGFCPAGPECEFAHPKLALGENDASDRIQRCFKCGEVGHLYSRCPQSGAAPVKGAALVSTFRPDDGRRFGVRTGIRPLM